MYFEQLFGGDQLNHYHSKLMRKEALKIYLFIYHDNNDSMMMKNLKI